MHETGAIEAAGHKVLTVPSVYGKAEADAVRAVVKAHNNEHMVKPKLLYISQATEQGTVYTSTELEALREACYENGLYLFIDGARLGNALASKASGLSLTDYADLADAFCIGGTKNGLLFGEALVICNPVLTSDFRFLLKQRGGLLSKGFLLGIQFQAILEDGLYFELAQQANAMAALLSEKLQQAGVSLMAKTVTNQVFFFASAEALERLKEEVLFEVWDAESDNGTPIRLVTTWQTTEEEVEAVASIVKG
jgi:threonine aldolase